MTDCALSQYLSHYTLVSVNQLWRCTWRSQTSGKSLRDPLASLRDVFPKGGGRGHQDQEYRQHRFDHLNRRTGTRGADKGRGKHFFFSNVQTAWSKKEQYQNHVPFVRTGRKVKFGVEKEKGCPTSSSDSYHTRSLTRWHFHWQTGNNEERDERNMQQGFQTWTAAVMW